VEKDTSTKASFASAKVVIDSLCMNPIEDEAILQVGDKGFRVSVLEAKTEFIIIHTGPLDEENSASFMKVKCSQKVDALGYSDEVAAKADLAHEDWHKGLSHDEEQDGKEGEQPIAARFNLNSNSILARDEGQHSVSLNDSTNSATRTKTVSFSQNCPSEEAIKLYLLKSSLGNGEVNSSLKFPEVGTTVLKTMEEFNELSRANEGVCLSPLGVERGECESVEPPPDFENLGTAKLSKKIPRRQHQSMERRMTRSQKKVGKSSSQVTTESMIKLVEESLEIGRILRIRVTAKEKIAKRQITNSLKEEKRKRSNLD